MNFFGHAAVARWVAASAPLHFGAMLPDFAGMVGAGAPTVHVPEVQRGVDYHHVTDEVFHRTAAFRHLSSSAARHLFTFGIHRGGALASGHVGVEILIDCVFGRDSKSCDDYLAALGAGAPAALRTGVEWATLAERERFSRLYDVLTARGLEVIDPAPERVAQRVCRALARRPRLALGDTDTPIVEAWARGALTLVADAMPTLVAELRSGLDRAWMTSARWVAE